MLFYAGLLPSPSSISPTAPPRPQKKLFRICVNPMTQYGRAEWARAQLCLSVATLLFVDDDDDHDDNDDDDNNNDLQPGITV